MIRQDAEVVAWWEPDDLGPIVGPMAAGQGPHLCLPLGPLGQVMLGIGSRHRLVVGRLSSSGLCWKDGIEGIEDSLQIALMCSHFYPFLAIATRYKFRESLTILDSMADGFC